MIGCQSNVVKELKSDLHELGTELQIAKREIDGLKSRIIGLKGKLDKANLNYKNLQMITAETDEWIGYLIKAIGPCVWESGRSKRPIPSEIVRDATPMDLLTKLNQTFMRSKSPEATLLKVVNETAYIKIDEDEKLTQRMGSFGAASYINSIVFTLYSIEEIKCVDLEFKPGDHAVPRRYCPGQDYKKENLNRA